MTKPYTDGVVTTGLSGTEEVTWPFLWRDARHLLRSSIKKKAPAEDLRFSDFVRVFYPSAFMKISISPRMPFSEWRQVEHALVGRLSFVLRTSWFVNYVPKPCPRISSVTKSNPFTTAQEAVLTLSGSS